MKGKLVITVMMGLLCLSFLSSIAMAVSPSLTECTNTLNACTTSLGTCNTDKANAQANLSACHANLAASQANLATCQANTTQTVPPPSWYQKLPCDSTSNCPRFEVLADWNNEAVLDKETGLVWEQSPSTSTSIWENAQFHCNVLGTGRAGWRLPTLQELSSLVDRNVALPGPSLPAGHPFNNVQSSFYWSATTSGYSSDDVWGVLFYSGQMGTDGKGNLNYVWCVRGGQGVDPQ